MSGDTLTMALPKGRLQHRIQEYLAAAGYQVEFEERKLVAEDPSGAIRIMLVKNSDLPT